MSLVNRPEQTRTNATRSRWRGSMFAWILKTKPREAFVGRARRCPSRSSAAAAAARARRARAGTARGRSSSARCRRTPASGGRRRYSRDVERACRRRGSRRATRGSARRRSSPISSPRLRVVERRTCPPAPGTAPAPRARTAAASLALHVVDAAELCRRCRPASSPARRRCRACARDRRAAPADRAPGDRTC